MENMDATERNREQRARSRKFAGALSLLILGMTTAALAFLFARERTGEAATLAGVTAGVGVGVSLGALVVGWKHRPWDRRWQSEPAHGRRERLHRQRARQLWVLPIVTLLLLGQASRMMEGLGTGEIRLVDKIWILLPVLYAWVVVLITMGRDQSSLRNRRFLEDELTVLLRARALGAAFLVLMVGVTVALGLGLWRLDIGVLALPYALSAAGVTAGMRFAWLDREAGLDE
jgi:hypothetical protein